MATIMPYLLVVLALMSVGVSCGLLDPILSSDPDDVHFYLYPTAGDKSYNQEIIYNNPSTLQSSLFQSKFPTTFIIHGFRSNSSSEMSQSIKDAYLASGLNYNFIVVDWGLLSTPVQPLTSALYALVTANVPIVANRVAQFIQFLVQEDVVNPAQIHAVGHSLGAHISGLAGLYSKDDYNYTLGRITGLDPAGPLYFPPISCRNLVKSDAAFVDVIHTNMGTLGDVTADGNADFYPNGGVSQPGCALNDTGLPALDPSTVGVCSHRFAYKLYAESITRTFNACKYFIFPTLCTTTYVKMGFGCPTTAQGQFYIETTNPP